MFFHLESSRRQIWMWHDVQEMLMLPEPCAMISTVKAPFSRIVWTLVDVDLIVRKVFSWWHEADDESKRENRSPHESLWQTLKWFFNDWLHALFFLMVGEIGIACGRFPNGSVYEGWRTQFVMTESQGSLGCTFVINQYQLPTLPSLKLTVRT